MGQYYSNPKRADDPHALPDVEVFYVSKVEARENAANDTDGEESSPMTEPGWYWWSCFPGCLPDSDPFGPFATEAEALTDAREDMEDEDDE